MSVIGPPAPPVVPPPAPGSPPKAVPPPPPPTSMTSVPSRTADPPPPAPAPKEEVESDGPPSPPEGGGVGMAPPAPPAPAEAEAALCRFHARPVSAGSLALAADDDGVDRSGRHGDRRLRPTTESGRDVTQCTAGRALDDERRLVDAGRDRPGLLTAGAGEDVGHQGCLSHADGG